MLSIKSFSCALHTRCITRTAYCRLNGNWNLYYFVLRLTRTIGYIICNIKQG